MYIQEKSQKIIDLSEEKSNILIMMGPSGVGKGTLINMVMEEFKGKIVFSVSHTTRVPRAGEVNGINYHFIPKGDFEEMIVNNGFVEYNCYNNNYYGTSFSEINKSRNNTDKIILLELDVNGAEIIRNNGIYAKNVAILPPSIDILKERIIKRGGIKDDDITSRLEIAKIELGKFENDKNDLINHKILNDNLEDSYAGFKSWLLDNFKHVFSPNPIQTNNLNQSSASTLSITASSLRTNPSSCLIENCKKMENGDCDANDK